MSSAADYAESAHYALENPERPELLVVLHGLGANHRQPLALLDGFGPAGSALLAPDARAHGLTMTGGRVEDFTFTSLVADLRSLLHRTGQSGKPIHLLGISMGAGIAVHAAVNGLIPAASLNLVRPAFSDQPLPEHLGVMALIGSILRTRSGELGKRTLAASDDYRRIAEVSPLAAASLMAQFDDPRARQRADRLRSVPRNTAYSFRSELTRVSVPTLIVGTDRDPVHPLELAETYAQAIPTAVLTVVPPRDDDARRYARASADAVGQHLTSVVRASTTIRKLHDQGRFCDDNERQP